MTATNKLVRMGERPEICCAAAEVIALVGSKWTVMIVGALGRQERSRYTELQRAIRGISQRMLTLNLKTLEENGIVKRTVFPTVPPRVEYELTPLGHTLYVPLKALRNWAADNRTAMAEARVAYAEASKP